MKQLKCPHCQNDDPRMIEVHTDKDKRVWLFCLVCAKAWWGDNE